MFHQGIPSYDISLFTGTRATMNTPTATSPAKTTPLQQFQESLKSGDVAAALADGLIGATPPSTARSARSRWSTPITSRPAAP